MPRSLLGRADGVVINEPRSAPYLTVGAVYDRPHFVDSKKKRALIERPYRRLSPTFAKVSFYLADDPDDTFVATGPSVRSSSILFFFNVIPIERSRSARAAVKFTMICTSFV